MDYVPFELRICPKLNIQPKQFVSATPLKPLNRISCNFTIKVDILCTCAYSLEIPVLFFSERSGILMDENLILCAKLFSRCT